MVRVSGKKGLLSALIAGSCGLLGAFVIIGVSRVAKVEGPYGFRGEVFSVGDVGHEIHYGPGVEAQELVAIGDYLQRIGYFGPSYGGIIQLESSGRELEVSLSYSKQHWNKMEFSEEVAGIGHDLEKFVLKRPISVIAVDEDEAGLHHRNFYP